MSYIYKQHLEICRSVIYKVTDYNLIGNFESRYFLVTNINLSVNE